MGKIVIYVGDDIMFSADVSCLCAHVVPSTMESDMTQVGRENISLTMQYVH